MGPPGPGCRLPLLAFQLSTHGGPGPGHTTPDPQSEGVMLGSGGQLALKGK